MEFTARENNMGIISIYLKYAHRDKIGTDNPKTKLIINMKEKGTENWYSTSSYVPAEIGDTKIHPFGFPLIPDAKGKTYILNLYLQDKNENIDIIVKNQGDVIKTVHQINKSELFKNPQEMIALLKNKILTAVSDENAQLITLHVTPFMLFMLIVTFKPTLLERKKIN
jgi:ethanolamine utilization protein EutA (predicted chaperonin)